MSDQTRPSTGESSQLISMPWLKWRKYEVSSSNFPPAVGRISFRSCSTKRGFPYGASPIIFHSSPYLWNPRNWVTAV